MAFNREQAIQGALDMGQSVNEINTGLQSIGQKPLSGFEESLITHGNYGTNIAERFGINAKNIAQGLGTIFAAPWQYANDKDFRGAVNRTVSDYAQRFITGQTNPIEDFANMVLTPYDTNVEQIFKDPVQASKNIMYGAYNNPLDATLDAMSILPPGALAKGLSKIPNEGFQNIRRGVLPTDQERAINTLLGTGDINSVARRAQFEKDINKISVDKNLEASVRDLTTGAITPGIEDSRRAIKDFTERMNKELVDLGLDPNLSRQVRITQKVRDDLDPNRTLNIYTQNVQKAIDNPTQKNLEAIGLTNKNELDALVSNAERLDDEGRLATITQRGVMSEVDHRLVDLENLGSGITRERTFGTATPEQVARNFASGYRQLFNTIEKAKNSYANLEELATRYGRKIDADDITNIGKNEIVISPKEFRKDVENLFGKESRGNLKKITGDLERGVNPNTIKNYADDLYVVNKADLKAFTNSVKGLDIDTALGKVTDAIKPIMGGFKSNVLARPSYIAGNLLGNMSLGAIGRADFITALKPGMIDKYVPDAIKQSTSYRAYDSVSTNNFIDAYKDSVNRLRTSYKDLTDKNNNVYDKIKAAGELVTRSQEVALPLRQIFQLNNQAELLARSAAYFNEAKKYANRSNKTMNEVLDEALTNSELQRTLIDRVNSVLGDYVGRNYYIDPTFREFAATISPFYKVITTSADVARRQLYENPLRMQAFARIPARVGNEIQQVDRELGYQPTDDDPRGGMVITPTYSRRYPAVALYNNYQPFSAPLEIVQTIFGPPVRQGEGTGLAGIGSIFEGNITPVQGLLNALSGKDMYGNPVVGPNSYKIGNQIITLDNNGNRIEQPNILGALAGFGSRYFMPSATLFNSTIGPLVGGLSGRGFATPTNRSVFGQIGGLPSVEALGVGLFEGNPEKLRYREPEEAIREQLGFRQRNIYFPMTNRVSPYDMRQINRRRFMQEQMRMR